MAYNVVALTRLVEQLQRLPGIGGKTAYRLAFHIISSDPSYAKELSAAILEATAKVQHCKICCSLTDEEICSICGDSSRDQSVICVVADAKDIMTFERSGDYHGVYHVLHGLISPLEGVTAESLSFHELLSRIEKGNVKEVIMATNASVEGESTALYVSHILKPMGITVSRLAFGVPVGSLLEYADDNSLSKALEGRRVM